MGLARGVVGRCWICRLVFGLILLLAPSSSLVAPCALFGSGPSPRALAPSPCSAPRACVVLSSHGGIVTMAS
eukprot:1354874-Alexandrium_andersonii.AAC.1